jgi:hypothetical protein
MHTNIFVNIYTAAGTERMMENVLEAFHVSHALWELENDTKMY